MTWAWLESAAAAAGFLVLLIAGGPTLVSQIQDAWAARNPARAQRRVARIRDHFERVRRLRDDVPALIAQCFSALIAGMVLLGTALALLALTQNLFDDRVIVAGSVALLRLGVGLGFMVAFTLSLWRIAHPKAYRDQVEARIRRLQAKTSIDPAAGAEAGPDDLPRPGDPD